jgi:hypothetical protein
MANPRRTFYDDLGVGHRASGVEIDRAYRAFRKKMDDVSAVPEPAREARMKIAHETLSDPAKREAYDALLAGPQSEGGSKGGLFAVVGIVLVVAIAGGFFLLRPSAPPAADAGTRAVGELTRRAGLAVNRVGSTDLSGKAVPLGVAFAIGEGTAVTACNGISPTSILTLSVASQPVPARLAYVDDKLGICKLAASGIGASPLPMAADDPKVGDTVYMTQVDAAGVVTLSKAQVTRVAPSPRGGTVVETSVSVLPEQSGGPVLDERGMVVGAGLPAEVIRLTPEWASRTKQLEAPPPPAAAVPATAAAASPGTPATAAAPAASPAPAPTPPAQAAPKSPGSMTPEEVAEDRRRRLEEALQKNIPTR